MSLLFSIVAVCVVCLMALVIIFVNAKRVDAADTLLAFEDILKLGGAGVLIFDRRDRLKHANIRALDHFTALSEQLVAARLQDFIAYIFDHAADEAEDASLRYRAIQGAGDAAHFRETIIDDHGHSFLVEMYEGQKARTIVLIRDVSLLKAQHEHFSVLNKMNTKLSLAIESTSCAVFIVDPSEGGLPVIFSNRMCNNLADFYQDSDDVIAFSDLVSGLGSSEDAALIIDAVRGHEAMQKQVKFEKDGQFRWFDFRLSPVLNHEGHIDLCIGVLSEITELKMHEAEFYRSQKLESLGQLSAGIAHDFNNILSIIEGYARMIEMNISNPDKMVAYAEKIRESSTRAGGLTKKMMAFARHKPSQDKVCDVGGVLDEQLTLLKPLLDSSIDFRVVRDEGDLHGQCAGDDFVQIMMNLVVNARDAMPNGGVLDVSLSVCVSDNLPDFVQKRDCDYLCLRVRDSGMGMAKDVCERIFDPFFTTKEQGKGTGLGLSVVYGLVKDARGYIDVRSELSVGTEFYVYIPRAEYFDVSEDADVTKREGAAGLEGLTILVVEDEEDLKTIVSECLERQGMHVLQASHGNDALVVQDDYDGKIDFLLTDLVMPGMTGLKLAEMMKSLIPDLSVIYMSGYPARGEDAKVDIPEDAVFMPKPIDFDLLLAGIASVHKAERAQGAQNIYATDDYKAGSNA